MGKYNYAFNNFDNTKHVHASLREKAISHKHAREIAVTINGMSIEKARDYLLNVIQLKLCVPFKRYKKSDGNYPHEATLLKLDITKAREQLSWEPKWALETALEKTVSWYKGYYNGENVLKMSLMQIEEYQIS